MELLKLYHVKTIKSNEIYLLKLIWNPFYHMHLRMFTSTKQNAVFIRDFNERIDLGSAGSNPAVRKISAKKFWWNVNLGYSTTNLPLNSYFTVNISHNIQLRR